jgi:biopolymer transport protein ExbB/TolQ
LLAAIPALIAYNLFRNQARSLGNDLRDFSRELSNRIEWILYEQFVMARK